MSANDRQPGGEHYKSVTGIQHWDIMAEYDVPYLEGTATKYHRWKKKNGLEDLTKFQHYVEKIRELRFTNGYPAPSGTPADVWFPFCVANGVDPETAQACFLILNWEDTAQIDQCLVILEQLITQESLGNVPE